MTEKVNNQITQKVNPKNFNFYFFCNETSKTLVPKSDINDFTCVGPKTDPDLFSILKAISAFPTAFIIKNK